MAYLCYEFQKEVEMEKERNRKLIMVPLFKILRYGCGRLLKQLCDESDYVYPNVVRYYHVFLGY